MKIWSNKPRLIPLYTIAWFLIIFSGGLAYATMDALNSSPDGRYYNFYQCADYDANDYGQEYCAQEDKTNVIDSETLGDHLKTSRNVSAVIAGIIMIPVGLLSFIDSMTYEKRFNKNINKLKKEIDHLTKNKS